MAIEEYRDYKRKQSSSSSRSRTTSRSTSSRSGSTRGSASRGTSSTRKRPTGTVVKKRRRVKKI